MTLEVGHEQTSENAKEWRATEGQVPFENNEVMNGILESFHASVMAGITTDHYLVFFFPFLLLLFIFFQIQAFPKAPAS